MEDNVRCDRSRNIKVDCYFVFVDSVSLEISIKQLKEIKNPVKIIRDLIDELEECF